MGVRKTSAAIQLSVLDRLIDEDPDNSKEQPKTENQAVRELRQAVRRDLENLLNTRRRCVSWPPHLKQLDLSLFNYGIPDFTGSQVVSPEEKEDFRQEVEEIIKKFETRLKSIKVVLYEDHSELDQQLRFRVDALLDLDPVPEPIVFDTTVEPVSGTFEVASK